MLGYSNPPKVTLLVDRHVTRWDDQRWQQRPGGLWIAEHPDGRAQAHYHAGPLSYEFISVGTSQQDDTKATIWDIERLYDDRGYWRRRQRMLVTTPQEGYGGRHFHLKREDGETVVLRGPWHGMPPAGYHEVGYVVEGEQAARSGAADKRWWESGGYFGLIITTHLYRSLFDQLSDLSLAETYYWSKPMLEPIHPDWGCPKRFRTKGAE